MVQVDVFWTFAIGASYAAAAHRQLAREEKPLTSPYFVYTVLFLGVFFAPSGVYLLWRFPGWETMFFLDRDVHAIIPCLFASTNILFGVLGFWLAWRLIRAGRPERVKWLWIGGYAGMLSILGIGYRRFLYAGDSVDWANGVAYPLGAWFSSEVFLTLLTMGAVMGVPMLLPFFRWPKEGRAAEAAGLRLDDAVLEGGAR